MATISECRYRGLRVPATKSVENPSNLNWLLEFRFGARIDPNNINDFFYIGIILGSLPPVEHPIVSDEACRALKPQSG
jgi:hypothetical protein